MSDKTSEPPSVTKEPKAPPGYVLIPEADYKKLRNAWAALDGFCHILNCRDMTHEFYVNCGEVLRLIAEKFLDADVWLLGPTYDHD